MTDPTTNDHTADAYDPDVERADEVEDYTGGVERPSAAASERAGAEPGAGVPTGFGAGDVADLADLTDPVDLTDGVGAADGGADQLPHDIDVDALVAERDQLKELAVRLQADFENFRRRTTNQHAADIDRATGRLAEALLPVLDAAEAAYLQHPDEVGPLLNVMLGELRKHGLETLDLDGQPFDPEVAEAVAHEPGGGGAVVVADVLRSGYRWKGRTLRPAMVRTTD